MSLCRRAATTSIHGSLLVRLGKSSGALGVGATKELVVDFELWRKILLVAVGARNFVSAAQRGKFTLHDGVGREHHVILGQLPRVGDALGAMIDGQRQRACSAVALDLATPLNHCDQRTHDERAFDPIRPWLGPVRHDERDGLYGFAHAHLVRENSTLKLGILLCAHPRQTLSLEGQQRHQETSWRVCLPR